MFLTQRRHVTSIDRFHETLETTTYIFCLTSAVVFMEGNKSVCENNNTRVSKDRIEVLAELFLRQLHSLLIVSAWGGEQISTKRCLKTVSVSSHR